MSFGKALKKLIKIENKKQGNFTAYRLAVKGGLSHQTLSSILHRNQDGPKWETLKLLAKGFGLKLPTFVKRIEDIENFS